jgi:Fe2+ transport system protein FeoA
MTLMDVGLQECVHITVVDAGCGLRRRLEHMGLYPGDLVTVVSRAAFQGPLLVEAHGMRLAVGRGVASKINVAPTHAVSASGGKTP